MYGLKHSHTNISELLLSNIIWVPVALAIGVGFWYFGRKSTTDTVTKFEEQLSQKQLENSQLQQKINEFKEELDQTQNNFKEELDQAQNNFLHQTGELNSLKEELIIIKNNFLQQTDELNILKEQLKNVPIGYEEILEKYKKSPEEREALFNYLKEDPEFKAYYKGRGFNEFYENSEFCKNLEKALREKNVDSKYMDGIMDRMSLIGDQIYAGFASNNELTAPLMKMQRAYSNLLNQTFDFFINWHIDNNLKFDYKNFKYPALEGNHAGLSEPSLDLVEIAYEVIKILHGIH